MKHLRYEHEMLVNELVDTLSVEFDAILEYIRDNGTQMTSEEIMNCDSRLDHILLCVKQLDRMYSMYITKRTDDKIDEVYRHMVEHVL